MRWLLLINTVVALVGLWIAWQEREQSEKKMWLMISASIALTGPGYLSWFLGLIPGGSAMLNGLRMFLVMVGFVLRFPAYGVLVYGVFDIRKRRLRQEREIKVPTIAPYGQSAYDSRSEDPSGAPADRGHEAE